MGHSINPYLVPILLANNPKSSVPNMAPNEINDPIQPTSLFVIGPDGSGESPPIRIGNDGESHPALAP